MVGVKNPLLIFWESFYHFLYTFSIISRHIKNSMRLTET